MASSISIDVSVQGIESWEALSPIVRAWISQLLSPDILALAEDAGEKRRIDLVLYSDRGKVPRPPSYHVT